MTFVHVGRLKPLGITTTGRIDALPQVPTLAEAGYPQMVSSSWQGIFVPAGTPRSIVDKLYVALLEILESPEIRQRFAVGGVNAISSRTPEDFTHIVDSEITRWGKLAKQSGATID